MDTKLLIRGLLGIAIDIAILVLAYLKIVPELPVADAITVPQFWLWAVLGLFAIVSIVQDVRKVIYAIKANNKDD